MANQLCALVLVCGAVGSSTSSWMLHNGLLGFSIFCLLPAVISELEKIENSWKESQELWIQISESLWERPSPTPSISLFLSSLQCIWLIGSLLNMLTVLQAAHL